MATSLSPRRTSQAGRVPAPLQTAFNSLTAGRLGASEFARVLDFWVLDVTHEPFLRDLVTHAGHLVSEEGRGIMLCRQALDLALTGGACWTPALDCVVDYIGHRSPEGGPPSVPSGLDAAYRMLVQWVRRDGVAAVAALADFRSAIYADTVAHHVRATSLSPADFALLAETGNRTVLWQNETLSAAQRSVMLTATEGVVAGEPDRARIFERPLAYLHGPSHGHPPDLRPPVEVLDHFGDRIVEGLAEQRVDARVHATDLLRIPDLHYPLVRRVVGALLRSPDDQLSEAEAELVSSQYDVPDSFLRDLVSEERIRLRDLALVLADRRALLRESVVRQVIWDGHDPELLARAIPYATAADLEDLFTRLRGIAPARALGIIEQRGLPSGVPFDAQWLAPLLSNDHGPIRARAILAIGLLEGRAPQAHVPASRSL